jgi:hypothetical protein
MKFQKLTFVCVFGAVFSATMKLVPKQSEIREALETLGLSAPLKPKAYKVAWVRKMQENHPDKKNGGDANPITTAKDILDRVLEYEEKGFVEAELELSFQELYTPNVQVEVEYRDGKTRLYQCI